MDTNFEAHLYVIFFILLLQYPSICYFPNKKQREAKCCIGTLNYHVKIPVLHALTWIATIPDLFKSILRNNHPFVSP
jgi:hypothetical protein